MRVMTNEVAMANKDRREKLVKKPKKDAKSKTILREETPTATVQVIKKKRKESTADDD